MIERGKISSSQMSILMFTSITSTGILLLPSAAFQYAKRDVWIALIIGAILGFFAVFAACRLHQYFPKKTIVQYSEILLGRFVGKIIGFIYIFFVYYLNSYILREYSESLITNFLPKTPLFIVIGCMVLVCSFAVRGGVEVLGRCAQVFMPVVVLLFLLILILLIPDLDPSNIFPVMDNGMIPPLKGSLVAMIWFGEYMLISSLLPFVSDPKKGLRTGFVSVLATLLIIVTVSLIILSLFGELMGGYLFPVIVAVRYISIADFIEHVEAIIMAIWIVGAFMKITLFYYVTVLETAQWLKLSDYKPLVFPLGFLLILMCLWIYPDLQQLVEAVGIAFTAFSVFIEVSLPVLLLFLVFIRQRFQRYKGNQRHESV
ncbi:GerAB/ArcD/ProY family transporter [Scopulibacillus cellulosilyticus]|uniref:Endospore germination permease n=1 Tax=Scopulibacillus cellulosilyticus TaxID=2665665 RepID=A0ABW2PUU5_9BACL